MATRTPITLIEFCAGAAGLELGLRLVFKERLQTVAYVERESYAASNLVARMEESSLDRAPIWDDLTTFDGNAWRGLVDIFAAGFPCQPWSVAGSRDGTEDERWLWPSLAQRIREMGPCIVWVENVPGLVSGGGLEHVLSDLAEMGFNAEWGSLAAGQVGASHERERLYILAWHTGKARGLSILADADGTRRTSTGSGHSFDSGRESVSGCGTVADAGREGSQERGCERRDDGAQCATVERSGVALADTEMRRLGVVRESSERDGLTDGCHAHVADTASERKGRLPSPEGRITIPDAHWSIPVLCPGPGDTEAWLPILEVAPGLKPALCRISDGVADELDYRTDRLRLCGNGVHPLASAVAFTLLAHRALK